MGTIGKYCKRVAVVAVVLLVASCGFQPLHWVDDGAAQATLQHVRIAPIADREGVVLRNHLQKILYTAPAAAPEYTLHVDLRFSERNFGVRRSGESHFRKFFAHARVVVVSLATTRPIQEFTVQKSVSLTTHNVSVFALDRDRVAVHDELVAAIAADIRLRLLAQSASW